MKLVKKAYQVFRRMRSRNTLAFFRMVHGSQFIAKKNLYVNKGFNVVIEETGNVVIGENVFFNNNCSINALCGISIGDNCIFGENVHIYDHNHIYADPDIPINNQGFSKAEVVIGSNCWIGTNTVILKGVTIGDHSVIGANCVIYRDVLPGSVIACRQELENLNHG